jgi:DNA-binding helix-hairpin-helix protein with protein kinase domain
MQIYIRHQGKHSRKKIDVGKRIAGGGAGDIHIIPNAPGMVLKLYRTPEDRKIYSLKLEAMLAKPPRLPPHKHNGNEYHQLAWPDAIAETEKGDFLGFTMPEIDFSGSASLERMLQKKMRAVSGLPEFYGYRVSAAYNLAASVAELHSRGHHIIDLKPVNCRVYRANMLLGLLDCDGFSIEGAAGRRFHASQYTPEYIAPEASKNKPEELGEEQDYFALAVTIFRLLNNGLHPFQAKLPKGISGGTLQEMIEANYYAYGISGANNCFPAMQTIHQTFPTELRKMFDQAFTRKTRPSAAKWRDVLREYANPASGRLIKCNSDPVNHAHFGNGCGWCELVGKLATYRTNSQPTLKIKSHPKSQSGNAQPAAQGIPLSSLSSFRKPLPLTLAIMSAVVSVGISLNSVSVNDDKTPPKSPHREAPGNSQSTEKSRPIFSAPKNLTLTPINKLGFVKGNTNVRVGPGTQYSVIKTLPKGTEVRVHAKAEANWYLIEGKQDLKQKNSKPDRGFVFGDLLTIFP